MKVLPIRATHAVSAADFFAMTARFALLPRRVTESRGQVRHLRDRHPLEAEAGVPMPTYRPRFWMVAVSVMLWTLIIAAALIWA